MKKTNFFAVERTTSLLLACLLLLSLLPSLVLPAEAASSDKVLPEMSKFFETEYTQAKMTDYSRLLTVGIRSGSGDQVMEDIALQLSREASRALETKVSRIEPAIVVLCSVLVGIILLAVMLPLLHILSAIG